MPKFDVYGRYEVEVERRPEGWTAYRRTEGKRRRLPVAIPPDLPEEDLATCLDDLLHEHARPGASITRIG